VGSGEGILLDSVILIDHFNGIELATSYIRRIALEARVSAITRAEVLVGFEPADADRARQLLDGFLTIVIDVKIADLAAELRRTIRWRLPDALQAAVCIHHGLRLATRNVKDFSPDRFDFVVVPYEL
jgi:predicted nucleic acid-binding protein